MSSGVIQRRAFVCSVPGLALSSAQGQVNAEARPLTVTLAFGPRVPSDLQARLETWAAALQSRMSIWWPVIAARLASPGYTPPDHLALTFFRIDNPNVPAFTTRGPRINIDPWKLSERLNNPDTFGMAAHELVHVGQGYAEGAGPGWITEGIADYLRYYVLLPNDPGRFFDPRGLSATSGYQPTAGLLDWVERSSPGSVQTLNRVMRDGGDAAAALTRLAGAPPDALWAAYMATHPPAADAAAAARRARAIRS